MVRKCAAFDVENKSFTALKLAAAPRILRRCPGLDRYRILRRPREMCARK